MTAGIDNVGIGRMKRKTDEVISIFAQLEKFAFFPDKRAVMSRDKQTAVLVIVTQTMDVIVKFVGDGGYRLQESPIRWLNKPCLVDPQKERGKTDPT